MKTAIVIPARYASKRFPGKPLAMINGRTMLSRVVDIARAATQGMEDVSVAVATEDRRIADHALEIGVDFYMTSAECRTGSDRVLEAVEIMKERPDFVVNLQGDAPLVPPGVVRLMIETYRSNRTIEVVTPVHRLSWDDLDRLREAKKKTPFTGTTVAVGPDRRALWFSKHIIPAIRNENSLREEEDLSPVYQHMGLYAYTPRALEKFCDLPEGVYERMEGLEQLRLLENGIPVQTVEIEVERGSLHAGIDSPEDLERAEEMYK